MSNKANFQSGGIVMTCKKCSHNLGESPSVFCPNCGTASDNTDSISTTTQNETLAKTIIMSSDGKKYRWIAWLLFVITAIFAYCFFILIPSILPSNVVIDDEWVFFPLVFFSAGLGSMVLAQTGSSITVYENGIEGKGFVNFILSRECNLKYQRIKEVSITNGRLIVYTDVDKITFFVADAKEVLDAINKYRKE
jgi:hypothetical protein